MLHFFSVLLGCACFAFGFFSIVSFLIRFLRNDSALHRVSSIDLIFLRRCGDCGIRRGTVDLRWAPGGKKAALERSVFTPFLTLFTWPHSTASAAEFCFSWAAAFSRAAAGASEVSQFPLLLAVSSHALPCLMDGRLCCGFGTDWAFPSWYTARVFVFSARLLAALSSSEKPKDASVTRTLSPLFGLVRSLAAEIFSLPIRFVGLRYFRNLSSDAVGE